MNKNLIGLQINGAIDYIRLLAEVANQFPASKRRKIAGLNHSDNVIAGLQRALAELDGTPPPARPLFQADDTLLEIIDG